MGECNAEKISLLFEKNVTTKVIDLNVPENGNYFMSGVVQCAASQKENLKVTIDGKKLKEEISLNEKDKWTVASLTDNKNEATVFLSKGKHQVKISYGNSETPNISDIAVFRAGKASKPNLDAYEKYFKKLKSARLPANYASQKNNGNKNARIAPNPKGTYEHELDIDVAYTFYESNYYTQGEVVTFETKNTTTDPVMYFFNINGSPLNADQSWVNDDTDGLESYLSITIPVTGTYMLLLKAFNSPSSGTGNLWKNGALYKSNVAVAGNEFNGYNMKPNTDVNFFTAKSTAGTDTRLFVSGSSNEKMMYQNDDYSSYPASSDFLWGYNSRIKARFTNQTYCYVLVTAYSPTSTGKCDLYMNVLNATNEVLSVFPNLKRDDAMQTAPSTGYPKIRPGSYNCISWSGGITEFWTWPSLFSPWSSRTNNYQETFDNFYGNKPEPRYAGATSYSREGANESNASVALWANPNINISTEPANTPKFTHASVTKPGNNNPHGYDWESKPGTLERIFHPKNGLSGSNGYGNIVSYYKQVGSAGARIASGENVSLEESIANGWSEMDNAYFEEPEINKLDYLCQNISSETTNEFYGLFYALDNIAPDSTNLFSSNPNTIYANNTSYQNLLNWFNSHGSEVYPLIIKNYDVDNKAMLLIAERILATAYPDLLESIKLNRLPLKITF